MIFNRTINDERFTAYDLRISQAQALEHGHVFGDGRARRGQHVARNRGRRAVEQGCGPVFRQEFAAGSQADVGFGIDEAEEGDGPQDIATVELGPMFQGRAGNGHEGVDGNGLDAQFGQADGHVQAVFPGFPHADDAAGTDAEPFFLSGLDGADAVVISVGRADVWEETPRRLDIMVITGHARFVEAVQLFRRQQAVRRTEVDVQRLLHRAVRIQGFFKIRPCQGTARRDDGKAVGAGILIGLGVGQDFFFRQETVFFTARMVAGRLGTVFAVFPTAAAAAVDDGAEINMIATKMAL